MRMSREAKARRAAFLANLPEGSKNRQPVPWAVAKVFTFEEAVGRPLGNPLLQTGDLATQQDVLLAACPGL